MSGEPQLGLSCILYRNTGSVGTPTWTEVAQIGDLSANLTKAFGELKRRGNEWVKNIPGLKSLDSFSFRMIHGLDQTTLDAIRGNYFSDTVEEFLIYDGDEATSGNEGLRIPIAIENFPIDQPLEDIHNHEVTGKLGYMDDGGEVDPSWQQTA